MGIFDNKKQREKRNKRFKREKKRREKAVQKNKAVREIFLGQHHNIDDAVLETRQEIIVNMKGVVACELIGCGGLAIIAMNGDKAVNIECYGDSFCIVFKRMKKCKHTGVELFYENTRRFWRMDIYEDELKKWLSE